MKRKNKGITLVALVVTIIVLLILAGVSVNLIMGNDGILGKTEVAVNETQKQIAREQMDLKINSAIIECVERNGKMPTLQELADVLCENKDGELEYVCVKHKEQASLPSVNIESPEDILLTKLIAYSYEFEIDGEFEIIKVKSTETLANKPEDKEKLPENTPETDAGTVVEDYTTDLVYRLNFSNLSNEPGVTINGTGVTVSEDNKYVSFDGNSYINVSNDIIDPDSTIRTKPDTSLCCWYRTTTAGTENILVMFGENEVDGVANDHFVMFRNSAEIGASQGYATCARYINPANFKDGNWHFVVGIWKNNNTVEIYYDGVPFVSTGSYNVSNSYLNIGGSCDARYYTGDLSDIRVYDKALTEIEVKQIYEYGKKYLEID